MRSAPKAQNVPVNACQFLLVGIDFGSRSAQRFLPGRVAGLLAQTAQVARLSLVLARLALQLCGGRTRNRCAGRENG